MVVIQQYDEGKRIVLISNGKEGMNESKEMYPCTAYGFTVCPTIYGMCESRASRRENVQWLRISRECAVW